MMKKNSTKGYVILGILFALVSIVAFAVPTVKTSTFWIAYVFTVAAFAAQIGIWKTALGKEETLKSKLRKSSPTITANAMLVHGVSMAR